MNTLKVNAIKKIFATLLTAGVLILSPFSAYAAEDIASATDQLEESVTEIQTEPVLDESVVLPDESSTPVASSTTASPTVNIEPEVIETVVDSIEVSTSTTPEIATSTTLIEVEEEIVDAEQPVFFTRAKIEPVQPPSRESFRDQPKLRVATEPGRAPTLVPPPFAYPIEQIISPATTTDLLADVATTSEPVDTTGQASSTDPVSPNPAIEEPPVESDTGTTTPELIIPDDGQPIGTPEDEIGLPISTERDIDPEPNPEDSSLSPTYQTPITKPEDSTEETFSEVDVSPE